MINVEFKFETEEDYFDFVRHIDKEFVFPNILKEINERKISNSDKIINREWNPEQKNKCKIIET